MSKATQLACGTTHLKWLGVPGQVLYFSDDVTTNSDQVTIFQHDLEADSAIERGIERELAYDYEAILLPVIWTRTAPDWLSEFGGNI